MHRRQALRLRRTVARLRSLTAVPLQAFRINAVVADSSPALAEVVFTLGGTVRNVQFQLSQLLQEIAFTTSLHKELEALEDLREMCRRSPLTHSGTCRTLRNLRFHRVVADDFVEGLEQESALDTRWTLLARLKEQGCVAAAEWLAKHAAKRRPLLRAA